MSQTNGNDSEFTRNLNERIKKLEDMTKELNTMSEELNHHASKGEETAEMEHNDETGMVNLADDARAEGDTLYFTATVDSAAPLKLNITSNNGEIHVSSGDVEHVEMTATRTNGEDSEHNDWFFGTVDNEITLRPNWQVSNQLGGLASKIRNQFKDGFDSKSWSKKDFTFGVEVQYDLVVTVPRSLADDSRINVKVGNGDITVNDVQAHVNAKSANGDVSVSGISGNATVSSANGDVRLSGVTGGSVEGNTANGDVAVSRSRGAMALRTAAGDVTVTESELLGGRIATVAGDVQVRAALSGTGTYAFDSVSGDVNVVATVPAGGASLSVKSLSGDVNTHGELVSTGKREWKVGEGNGPSVSAKTVSGDVSVTLGADDQLQAVTSEETEPAEDTARFSPEKDINVNLDLELERAKGWVMELGSRLSQVISGEDIRNKKADTDATIEYEAPEAPKAPEAQVAPEAPEAPEAPQAAEAPQSETAARRARLLEAVKNGEMTVDEALAQLDQA